MLTCLGRALETDGKLPEAATAYQQAWQLRQELGETNRAMEAQAGLARIALAQGRLSTAQAHGQAILHHLTQHTVDGTEEPLLIYLTCYQVLARLVDPQAALMLQQAYQELQKRAAQIDDLHFRRTFWETIAVHRTITALWAAHAAEQ